MPDFESVFLGAPYKADVTFRGRKTLLSVDDQFEACIPSLSKSDTRLAAVLADETEVEFREIEGRLFRTFLCWNGMSWTVDRLNEDWPPTIMLDFEWPAVAALTTSLLGSPFRPWPFEVSDRDRARAGRAGRKARDEAANRLEAVVARGLRFVDRVLFQETRTPCFAVGVLADEVFPVTPDIFPRHPLTLIDPRLQRRDLADGLAELGYRIVRDGLDIVDPSLLPDTVEADALASFCVWVYHDLCRRPLGDHDPRFVMRALELVHAAEAALKDGAALDQCYEMIGNLADYDPGRGRNVTQVEEFTLQTARGARTFLEMKRRLPPLTSGAEPIDEIDAEHIATSFKP